MGGRYDFVYNYTARVITTNQTIAVAYPDGDDEYDRQVAPTTTLPCIIAYGHVCRHAHTHSVGLLPRHHLETSRRRGQTEYRHV